MTSEIQAEVVRVQRGIDYWQVVVGGVRVGDIRGGMKGPVDAGLPGLLQQRRCASMDAGVEYVLALADGQPGVCEWFALCTEPAAGTVGHPVLGAVPCCASCAAKHGLTLEAVAS